MKKMVIFHSFFVISPLRNRSHSWDPLNPPSSTPGVLPPVLCAPFEDPEDYDDIANGVPILHGLRLGDGGDGGFLKLMMVNDG